MPGKHKLSDRNSRHALSLYFWLVPLAPPIVSILCFASLFALGGTSKRSFKVPEAFSLIKPRAELLAGFYTKLRCGTGFAGMKRTLKVFYYAVLVIALSYILSGYRPYK